MDKDNVVHTDDKIIRMQSDGSQSDGSQTDILRIENNNQDVTAIITPFYDINVLQRKGTQLIQSSNSLFRDMSQIIDHPMFQDFANKYFSSWKSTQLITQLCRMYADLDRLSTQIIDPYEKLTMLQEVIFTEWMEIDSRKADQMDVFRSSPSEFPLVRHNRRSLGMELYQINPVMKDVADVMEHEYTRTFIQKYFLQWDTSDLVVVLIKLYRCFDRFPDWTTEQKMGFLHSLISDPPTRQLLVQKITEWKKV